LAMLSKALQDEILQKIKRVNHTMSISDQFDDNPHVIFTGFMTGSNSEGGKEQSR